LISHPTPKRLSTVCTWADQESTQDGVALKVYNALGGDPPTFSLDPRHPEEWYFRNPWEMLIGGAAYDGDCRDLANLMRHAIGVVGAPGTIGYTYATTDAGCYSTSDLAWETRQFQYQLDPPLWRTEYLTFMAGGWNQYEAVCVVNNHYYAPKVTHAGSAMEILKSIVCPNTDATRCQCWAEIVNKHGVCNTAPPYPVAVPGGCP